MLAGATLLWRHRDRLRDARDGPTSTPADARAGCSGRRSPRSSCPPRFPTSPSSPRPSAPTSMRSTRSCCCSSSTCASSRPLLGIVATLTFARDLAQRLLGRGRDFLQQHWPAALAVVGVLAGPVRDHARRHRPSLVGTLGVQPLHAPLSPPPDPAPSLAGRVNGTACRRPRTPTISPRASCVAGPRRCIRSRAMSITLPDTERVHLVSWRGYSTALMARSAQQLREIMCPRGVRAGHRNSDCPIPRARDGLDADDR